MAVIKITDKPDRIATIATEVKSPKRHESIHFRGKMVDMPVARLVIDLPVYRMKNGRTQVEQYEYLEENGQQKNFFESGEGNISAQQAQHEILLKLSKDSKGPIYLELERVASQRQPLLLTSDGVVLNGNRRLAAMRDLFEHNAGSYASFSHIDAVILPTEATEKDLELLEAELQMAPEMKLEYGWVERRMKLLRHTEVLKIPRDQIKETYRFRRVEDINVELQQLELAEEYLERYLAKPHAYREVAQSEQLFKDLERALRGKSGAEAEVRRLVGYLMVKEARNLGNRVYRYNPIFGQDFDKVMTRFIEDEGIESVETLAEVPTEDVSDNDPLADLDEGGQSPYEGLKHILEDQENTKETAEKLSSVFESLREEEKEKDSRQAALKGVQKANRTLHEIDLSEADPATFSHITSQLNTIISVSESLKDELDKLTVKAS